MKQIYIAVIFMFCLSAKAQNLKEHPGNKRGTENAQLRNSVVTIDGKNFDYRILRYYTEVQLRSMSPAKRNQVLFMYTASYTITGKENCPSFSEKDIDVQKLDALRKENETSTVDLGTDCKVHLQLISRQLFRQKMDELKK